MRIDRLPMREAEEKGAHLQHTGEARGLCGEFEEKLLQDIARVGFAPGEVQQEGEQRRGVVVVKLAEVGGHGSFA